MSSASCLPVVGAPKASPVKPDGGWVSLPAVALYAAGGDAFLSGVLAAQAAKPQRGPIP
jgi:hypothetical protein